MEKIEFNLDSVLTEIGEFGRFQTQIYISVILPVLLVSFFCSSFIFTTGNLDYRCRIPQCDNAGSDLYKQDWLNFTTPLGSKCTQYQFHGDDNYMEYVNNQCRGQYFNQSNVVHCHEFVYKTDSLTILNDFDLTCEKAWKLTTIGSLKNIAEVVILPVTGIISDRFGRKSLLIGSLLLSGISGTVTSFSINYWMYAIMEFITSMCAAGIYMSVFILGMELVGANKRVLGGTIIAQIFAVGQVILGFVAMNITNYRHLLRTIYLPTALVLSYIWYIPESVRWLMSKGQNKKALKIIYQAAKTNRVELSNSTLDSMYDFSDNEPDRINKTVVGTAKSNPFLLAIRSRVLIVRFLICCFCWFTNGFVYYGISIHAVTLAGNKYINFILVSVAEVPAIIITYFLMQNFRRKWSLQLAMLICAVVCITSEFVSDFSPVWKLVLFGIGKCAISIAFTVSYVYTTELFPTNLRQSFMSSCNMISRVGAMIAPQTPLLASYVPQLPAFLFGGTSMVSCLLVFLLSETFNMKLPDTIEEAEGIGK
ncbi:organic cation transporter protein-like [Bradysia coprophila]|uniref:organic cation transporter protein-like n=1 Tax=Bradysia coprophila TaxID=38358 RepID=UPI00187D8541|nr:organic cation transporter protein-like [Bradysia coprophila]